MCELHTFVVGGGIAEWLAFSDLNAEGLGSNPGVGKEFSDGTCKYLPCTELLLC